MDDRPAKRQRMMDTRSTVNGQLDVTGATVKIKVGKGPQSKIFHVHENVLEKGSSPFFRTALKAEWKERRGCDQTIKLEHHEPNVFEAYIRWVYNGVYAIDIPDEYHLCSLVRAYVLGEEILNREFQNTVIIWLLKSPRVPNDQLVKISYDMSPKESPLRRLCVDKWAQKKASYIRENLNDKYDQQFVLDVAIAVAERSSVEEHRVINTSLENMWFYLHKDLGMDTEK